MGRIFNANNSGVIVFEFKPNETVSGIWIVSHSEYISRAINLMRYPNTDGTYEIVFDPKPVAQKCTFVAQSSLYNVDLERVSFRVKDKRIGTIPEFTIEQYAVNQNIAKFTWDPPEEYWGKQLTFSATQSLYKTSTIDVLFNPVAQAYDFEFIMEPDDSYPEWTGQETEHEVENKWKKFAAYYPEGWWDQFGGAVPEPRAETPREINDRWSSDDGSTEWSTVSISDLLDIIMWGNPYTNESLQRSIFKIVMDNIREQTAGKNWVEMLNHMGIEWLRYTGSQFPTLVNLDREDYDRWFDSLTYEEQQKELGYYQDDEGKWVKEDGSDGGGGKPDPYEGLIKLTLKWQPVKKVGEVSDTVTQESGQTSSGESETNSIHMVKPNQSVDLVAKSSKSEYATIYKRIAIKDEDLVVYITFKKEGDDGYVPDDFVGPVDKEHPWKPAKNNSWIPAVLLLILFAVIISTFKKGSDEK